MERIEKCILSGLLFVDEKVCFITFVNLAFVSNREWERTNEYIQDPERFKERKKKESNKERRKKERKKWENIVLLC